MEEVEEDSEFWSLLRVGVKKVAGKDRGYFGGAEEEVGRGWKLVWVGEDGKASGRREEGEGGEEAR